LRRDRILKLRSNFHTAHLTGLAGGSSLRSASFEGRTHLIVPVVAMVGDSVVHPANSKTAELVLSSELAIAPAGWNGRPVVPDHITSSSGVYGDGSANEPETLEKFCFGRVFNSRFDRSDNRLKMDAWLDIAKAESLGGDPLSVIRRLKAGEMVEVSVCAFILTEPKSGVKSGKVYSGIWRRITPDHLAMLPKSMQGACSISAGCGAPRSASGNMKTVSSSTDLTNQDKSSLLESAVYEIETEAKYVWVMSGSINDDSGTFVYQMKTEDEGESQLYQRTFSISDDNKTVTLGTERIPVRERIVYEPENDPVEVVAASKIAGEKPKVKTENRLIAQARSLLTKAFRSSAAVETETETGEEAAELVHYNTMDSLLNQASATISAAKILVGQLISDETENPTDSPEAEAAEMEIECARLESIMLFCYEAVNSLYTCASSSQRCIEMMMENAAEKNGDGIQNVRVINMAGRRNSTKDQKTIQAVHDHTISLGAMCSGSNLESKTKSSANAGKNENIGDPSSIRAAASCGCNSENRNGDTDTMLTEKEKKNAVARLISNAASPFTEDDEKTLMSFKDDRIAALAAKYTDDSKTETPVAAASNKPADPPKAQTIEEFLATAPAPLVAMANGFIAAENAHRSAVIASLKSLTTGIYTEEQLNGKPTDELDSLLALASKGKTENQNNNSTTPVSASYFGRGIPIPPVEKPAPRVVPKSWDVARSLRAKGTETSQDPKAN